MFNFYSMINDFYQKEYLDEHTTSKKLLTDNSLVNINGRLTIKYENHKELHEFENFLPIVFIFEIAKLLYNFQTNSDNTFFIVIFQWFRCSVENFVVSFKSLYKNVLSTQILKDVINIILKIVIGHFLIFPILIANKHKDFVYELNTLDNGVFHQQSAIAKIPFISIALVTEHFIVLLLQSVSIDFQQFA